MVGTRDKTIKTLHGQGIGLIRYMGRHAADIAWMQNDLFRREIGGRFHGVNGFHNRCLPDAIYEIGGLHKCGQMANQPEPEPIQRFLYVTALAFDLMKMGLGRIHGQLNIIHPKVGNGFDLFKYRIHRKIHGAKSHIKTIGYPLMN